MRSHLYDAVREATRGEFEILDEMDSGPGWAAYLARALESRALALLLLHEADDGANLDLEVAEALDDSVPVGRTTCRACGTVADGWPRFCGGCRRDLSGVAADEAAPGGGAGDLLEEVSAASAGVYEVLGAMRHAEGGGAVYFAREEGGGRIVGLVLQREAGDELSLEVSWAAGADAPATLPEPAGGMGEWDEPATHADHAPAPFERAVPPVVLLDEVEPARPRRSPERTRRVLLGTAGALLVGASVAVAFLLLQRDPAPVPEVAKIELAQPLPPAVPPAQTVVDSALPGFLTPVDTPRSEPSRDAPPPERRKETQRRTAQPEPPVPVDVPEPQAPSPEVDQQRVVAAVGRYAAALESREMGSVRDAYPGIGQREVRRWEEWFQQIRGSPTLEVRHTIHEEPEIDGDGATVVFTLTMTYGNGQRYLVTSRGNLRRSGDGWSLQEVRALQ